MASKASGFHTSSIKNGLQNFNYITGSSPYIYYRIFGYSVGAAVHILNFAAMGLALRGPIMKDSDVKHFYSMKFFYITIWNLIFQVLYTGIGFACDISVLMNKKNKYLDWLHCYRKKYYSGIIWPCGMIIFTIFWPFYIYDREMIFPTYIDKALSQASNYVMHMFIVFPIVWDLCFLPNQKPKSQKYTARHCIGVCTVYYIALFSLYGWRGVWPYPILKIIYGTIYFPVVFALVFVWLMIIYCLQWPLMSCIWEQRKKRKTV